MATKTITITTEAYDRLVVFKGNKDSFSDVIKKLAKRKSLLDIAGVLSNKEANKLEKSIKDIRKRINTGRVTI